MVSAAIKETPPLGDEPDTLEVIVTYNDYPVLLRLLKERREELGLTQTDVDALAGMPDGYTCKIESHPKVWSRTLGLVSLPLLLTTLGLRLAVVKDRPPLSVINYKRTSAAHI